jgi:hypothetical protein
VSKNSRDFKLKKYINRKLKMVTTIGTKHAVRPGGSPIEIFHVSWTTTSYNFVKIEVLHFTPALLAKQAPWFYLPINVNFYRFEIGLT